MGMAAVPRVAVEAGPEDPRPGLAGCGVEAGAGVPAVVGLDRADGGEQRPVEAGAAPAGGLVGLSRPGGHRR